MGLHTGECEVRGNDLGGLAVHIAARVGSLASPNEVLVSSTVTDLVVGSGIEFNDRGEHVLKGRRGAGSSTQSPVETQWHTLGFDSVTD
jgi:class 3 adenylate cyclase